MRTTCNNNDFAAEVGQFSIRIERFRHDGEKFKKSSGEMRKSRLVMSSVQLVVSKKVGCGSCFRPPIPNHGHIYSMDS